MYYNELDKHDNAIINELKENARLTYSEIGERVGLSRVAVKNRITALEEKKIIKGYHVQLDEQKINENAIEFILDIHIVPEKYLDVIDGLAKAPEIRRLVTATGKDCRVYAFGLAPSATVMHKYVDRLYYSLSGIEAITFTVVMSTIKDVDGGVDYERYKQCGPAESERGEGESVSGN